LFNHFKEEEKIIHERNVSKEQVFTDLFDEMKDYWHDKKNMLKKEVENKELEADLRDRINDLHEKELEWQKLKLEHEHIEDELYRREIEIESRIKEFRKLYAKLVCEVNVQHGTEFILSDGTKIKSYLELIDELKIMDENVFATHVNSYKNDFSNWLNNVLDLSKVAQKLKNTTSRVETIKILIDFYRNH